MAFRDIIRTMPVLAMLGQALTLFNPVNAIAYGGGGGGGGSSCEEASFFQMNPAGNSTVSSFSQFSFMASGNTDTGTLDVQINGVKSEPVVTQQRSGDLLLEVKPATAITQPGKVRITLKAKSKEGCETFQPIYIEVKPN